MISIQKIKELREEQGIPQSVDIPITDDYFDYAKADYEEDEEPVLPEEGVQVSTMTPQEQQENQEVLEELEQPLFKPTLRQKLVLMTFVFLTLRPNRLLRNLHLKLQIQNFELLEVNERVVFCLRSTQNLVSTKLLFPKKGTHYTLFSIHMSCSLINFPDIENLLKSLRSDQIHGFKQDNRSKIGQLWKLKSLLQVSSLD